MCIYEYSNAHYQKPIQEYNEADYAKNRVKQRRLISAKQFATLRQEKDPNMMILEKCRQCFVYGGR